MRGVLAVEEHLGDKIFIPGRKADPFSPLSPQYTSAISEDPLPISQDVSVVTTTKTTLSVIPPQTSTEIPPFTTLSGILECMQSGIYTSSTALKSLDSRWAPSVIEVIQTHLDSDQNYSDATTREACIRYLLHLSKHFGSLPRSMFLTNLAKDGFHPVTGGGYADIWKGTYNRTRNVCLKVLRIFIATYNAQKLAEALSDEVMIWRQLRHPNILELIGVSDDLFYPSFCIVSPWMENGTVIAYTKSQGSSTEDKISMIMEISQGIQYLHKHHPPVVHGDIKGANILVSDDGQCRLADFGLATFENDDIETPKEYMCTNQAARRGSVPWLAPEVMNPDHVGITPRTSRDIYAVGCTIFEILTGTSPFCDKNDVRIMVEVLQGRRPERPLECPEWLWQIVESCWTERVLQRLGADQLTQRLNERASTPKMDHEDIGLTESGQFRRTYRTSGTSRTPLACTNSMREMLPKANSLRILTSTYVYSTRHAEFLRPSIEPKMPSSAASQ
uniref:Protein kinase domain-containing protein n=1 Tax=Moniliophthora roreri TaxID=221103 RepID=A0A0W0G7T2_MONRR